MRPSARVSPHALREFHQGAAFFGMLDGVKGAQESYCVRLGKDFCQQVVHIRVAAALVLAEERGDWQAQNGGHTFEPASCYTIGAVFVFLNLLEGYPDLFGERRLRHSQTDAVDPDTLA